MTVIEALTGPFDPPPYPYDRLNRLKPVCEAFDGGLVDLLGKPVYQRRVLLRGGHFERQVHRGLRGLRADACVWALHCVSVAVLIALHALGLHGGADAYPAPELLARLQRVVRRAEQRRDEEEHFANGKSLGWGGEEKENVGG